MNSRETKIVDGLTKESPVKLKYNTPELVEYGSILDLTGSGGGKEEDNPSWPGVLRSGTGA